MSGEYISREDVCIQLLKQESIDGQPRAIRRARRILENVPAADVVERPRWIPVTERLPESGTRALVMRFDFVTNTPFYDLLWFDKGEWWNRRYTGDYAVTHWQPLPEPPEGAP